jgi:hypothetical protein
MILWVLRVDLMNVFQRLKDKKILPYKQIKITKERDI